MLDMNLLSIIFSFNNFIPVSLILYVSRIICTRSTSSSFDFFILSRATCCFSVISPKVPLSRKLIIFDSATIGTFKSCVKVATKSSFNVSISLSLVTSFIRITYLFLSSSKDNLIECITKLLVGVCFTKTSLFFNLSIGVSSLICM